MGIGTGAARTAVAGQARTGIGTGVALGVAAVLLWGASPIASAFAVDHLDPVMAGMLRTLLAAAVLLPAALVQRLPLPADRGSWGLLLVSAVGGFVALPILFSLGVRQTSTAHASLILAASPVVTGFAGFVLARAWPRRLWWLGAAVALVGEALLILSRSGGSIRGEATLHGDLIVVVSMCCSATGYATGGRLAGRIGSWAVTAWGISIAGVLLLPFALLRARGIAWGEVGAPGWAGVVYLALFVSIIGYVLWYGAIGVAGVARIAPLQFAQPLVGLVLGLLLFDERLTPPILAAMAIILGGMLVTRRASRIPTRVPGS